MTDPKDPELITGLYINLWVDVTLACVIILALGVTIYRSCKATGR